MRTTRNRDQLLPRTGRQGTGCSGLPPLWRAEGPTPSCPWSFSCGSSCFPAGQGCLRSLKVKEKKLEGVQNPASQKESEESKKSGWILSLD